MCQPTTTNTNTARPLPTLAELTLLIVGHAHARGLDFTLSPVDLLNPGCGWETSLRGYGWRQPVRGSGLTPREALAQLARARGLLEH